MRSAGPAGRDSRDTVQAPSGARPVEATDQVLGWHPLPQRKSRAWCTAIRHVSSGIVGSSVRVRSWHGALRAAAAAAVAALTLIPILNIITIIASTGANNLSNDCKRRVSYLGLPHPTGLAVDTARGRVYVASTRNPNLVLEFAPFRDFVPREAPSLPGGLQATLLPVSCRYFPGCLYIHDLALIEGRLYANAVGMNAVVELTAAGFRPAWWPRCIDQDGEPLFGRNYLQLNSIAAGKDLASSYFSASAAEPSARRPGHLNFPVDKRGVIFSGRTRDVVASGLTRPHSARLVGKTVWVDNSGYGEFGCIDRGRFEPIVKLRGWTRGLYIDDGVAFVGTSRVIPRFRHYAPGVDPDTSEAGVHAIDLRSGRVLGSLVWPMGNQIFAIEISRRFRNAGIPFRGTGRQNAQQIRRLYFSGSPFDLKPPPGTRRRDLGC